MGCHLMKVLNSKEACHLLTVVDKFALLLFQFSVFTLRFSVYSFREGDKIFLFVMYSLAIG
jgi:hypothetical protein